VNIRDYNVNIQITDIPGQEQYRDQRLTCYRGVDVFMIVYDITNRESFEYARNHWITDIELYASGGYRAFLVGSKQDAEHKRMVSKQEGEELARYHKYRFIEVSAKTGSNIQALFLSSVIDVMKEKELLSPIKKPTINKPIQLTQEENAHKKCVSCV